MTSASLTTMCVSRLRPLTWKDGGVAAALCAGKVPYILAILSPWSIGCLRLQAKAFWSGSRSTITSRNTAAACLAHGGM